MSKHKKARTWTIYRGVNSEMFSPKNMEDWSAMLQVIVVGKPKFEIEVVVKEIK